MSRWQRFLRSLACFVMSTTCERWRTGPWVFPCHGCPRRWRVESNEGQEG